MSRAIDDVSRETSPKFTFDVRQLLGAAIRQIWVVLGTTFAVVVVATIIILQLAPRYTATALIQVDSATQRLTDSQNDASSFTTSTAFVASQVDIVQSDAVLRRTVQTLRLVDDALFAVKPSAVDAILSAILGDRRKSVEPTERESEIVAKLDSNLRVSRLGLGVNIAVNYTSTDPVKAALIANAIVDNYINVQVEKKVLSSRHASTALGQRVSEISGNLGRIEQDISAFITKNVTSAGGQISSEEIRSINQELSRITSERSAISDAITKARTALDSGDVQAAAASFRTLATAPGAPPVIVDLGSEIEKLIADREQASAAQAKTIDAKLSEAANSAVGRMSLQIESMSTRENELRNRLASAFGGQNGEAGVELFRLQAEADAARESYKVALALLQRAEIGSDVQVPDARVVSEAAVPITASFPPTTLLFAVASLLGVGLGFGLGLLRERFFTGFVSSSQLEYALNVPAVAAIPRTSPEHSPEETVIARPLSPFTEALRRWRLSLDGAVKAGAPLTLLVTSSLPNEGKSTLALSLARLYATSGKKTILIDCDMRKPVAGKLAGLLETETGGKGLFAYLSGNMTELKVEDLLKTDQQSNLDVIVSNSSNGLPTDHLIASSQFADLLTILRSHYEVIILDSPPLLPLIDGYVLARHVDVVTQVVRYGTTSPADVLSALNDLRMKGGPPVCAVLNCCDMVGTRYGQKARYGYGYGYGTAYGYGEKDAR